ncbi:malto-oligosyltrehalose synthase [Allopusillimonas soli]|uniref:Malto-oligosyltrehalose synthase n=1 Tax=Allopusillimonas soli TaxID=659016 RepID=A0A853FHR4_9BURK|nr:alpha-amylase family glycosyl hydrolase [Allopusillimonas soli]NYT37526.1 malto-oligosyltrehalose synthase [Allopusillimonas soli]TEA74500.1 malto-oligosyltrehalose synthase [Allopusillimonas soli]
MSRSVCATVRLQLNPSFTLDDACAQLPYYQGLGVSHLYLSPVTQARPGSLYGSDVINHGCINPEIGGERALAALSSQAHSRGMGLIVKIAPGFMATHPANPWWWDILHLGQQSRYARFLDIDWAAPSPLLHGRVLLPVLPNAYTRSLALGHIQLAYGERSGAYEIRAAGLSYPIAPGSLHVDGEDPQDVVKRHDAADAQGRTRLRRLLNRQHYRFAWWRSAASHINWRRCLGSRDLIGVRVEDDAVFDAVHACILDLYGRGVIDGVAVDDVDTLARPPAYCRRLRRQLAQRRGERPVALRDEGPWVLVQKILVTGEQLGADWDVDGTTGHDFMDCVSAVLHDADGHKPLTEAWAAVSRDARSAREYGQEIRRQLIPRHFGAERLALLACMAEASPAGTVRWNTALAGRALDGVLTTFPAARSYVDAYLAPPGPARDAICRFQQLTPAIMTVQTHTLSFRYGRLLSRNEAGCDPDILGISPAEFHEANVLRAEHAPRSMLSTAAEGRLRGEDARARLAVLSELPAVWLRASSRWMNWPNTGHIPAGSNQAAERYMLLQSMVGGWPLDLKVTDGAALRQYIQRLVQWQVNALRQASRNTGWARPDHWYEQMAEDFLISLVLEHGNYRLACDVAAFVDYIAPAGALNGLSQLLLRLTVPGVPDLCQGAEWWDFSLGAPDDARQVDYATRRALADTPDGGMAQWLANWRSGRLKQAILEKGLGFRREHVTLFAQGDYMPLAIQGKHADHALAFMRRLRDQYALVVVPRLCAGAVCGVAPDAVQDQGNPLEAASLPEDLAMAELSASPSVCGEDARLPRVPAAFWNQDRVVLPPALAGCVMRDVLGAGRHTVAADGSLRLASLLGQAPVALLCPDQG